MDSPAVDPVPSPLEGLPVGPANHFRVHFFLAVRALLDFVESLGAPGLLERHPFLLQYGEEVHRGPGHEAWWRDGVGAWESRHSGRLPIRNATRALGLPRNARLPLVLAGLVEEDLRFGTLFSELQAPLTHRRPTLELVGRIVAAYEGGGDPLRGVRPLVEGGYLEALDPGAPRAERRLRVPEPVWAALRGEDSIRAEGLVHHGPESFPDASALPFPASVVRRVGRAVALLEDGSAGVVVVEGAEGEDRLALLGSLAAATGRGVITFRPDLSGEPGEARPPAFVGPLCTLLDAIPVFRLDLGPGETGEVPGLRGYTGPVGVMRGREGGLRGPAMDRALVLSVPPLGASERRRAWRAALGPAAGSDLDTLVERYHLPGGHIRRLARMAQAEAALAGRDEVSLADVQEARRSHGREGLDTLAERIDSGADPAEAWDRLVMGATVRERLLELECRCRHRERLLDHLGPAFGTETRRGVRALFAGPSGTGKTLAARLLAARLGMDLYRVDLAAVVNKYIGETEKNLHRVLTAAEELDVLLLLDEGDALLGSRTEVKSSNDRYANLETNYLLQRLEHYDGVVVVTTNMGENVDPAFQRRMDLVVDFLPPGPEERRQLWGLHLPVGHQVDAPFLEAVSGQCALTGGQIRNAAQLATLLALDGDDGAVARSHLEAALRSEYLKAGATYALERAPLAGRRTATTHAFLGELTR